MNPNYCEALYLKGFALVDLNRIADARAIYGRLIDLAPMHAHFLTELGQTYRMDSNWPKMLELCERAFGLAPLAPVADVDKEKGAALRCQGYALIEQGKFSDAEKLYHQALAINPDDAKAKNELDYIREQRAKFN